MAPVALTMMPFRVSMPAVAGVDRGQRVEPDGAVTNEGARPWHRRIDLFSLIVLALGIAYVSLAWSPSSYGVALNMIGLKGEGLVAGKPKGIRSDEWAVWTPYTQVAVNNGFARTNLTSPYGEDLRNFNSLPLKDWALPFKPQFWLFFMTDPATAFSFSHAFYIILFLIGYHRLLRAFGFAPGWSATASVMLFCSAFVQVWWTTVGPVMAGFPWLLLAAMVPGPKNSLLRGAMVFYLTAFWLLAHVYPPIIISLAFAGLALLAAFRPQALRPQAILAPLVGAGLAAGLAWFYLSDVIPVMASTVYPGDRISVGGELSVWQAASQVLPNLMVTSSFYPVLAANVCEAASVGTWMLPLLLVFADHRLLAASLCGNDPEARLLRRRLAVLLVMLAAMTAWQLAPIPAWAGKFFLWHMVPGARMLFASGLLVAVIVLLLVQPAQLRLSRRRFGLFAALIAVTLVIKVVLGGPAPYREWKELLPLAGMGLLVLAVRRWQVPAGGGAVLAVATFANVITFGGFNPIQSAKPIFAKHDTAVTRELAQLQAGHPRGWLVTEGFTGATLNGLGFRSISHVLAAPRLDFFRPVFSGMTDAAFNQAFNRYAHIVLWPDAAQPYSPQGDVVRVPPAPFTAPAEGTP